MGLEVRQYLFWCVTMLVDRSLDGTSMRVL